MNTCHEPPRKYLILTSKPGQFRTELADGLLPVEAYDYVFCGRKIAHFVIAQLTRNIIKIKIKIVEETSPALVNHVPARLFEQYDTLERARAEVACLSSCATATLVAAST